jgi:hypothetical protein
MALSRLTTERVLAQIERVIQSNHEFRLNDSVKVNLVHVEMPNGGTGSKRSEINQSSNIEAVRLLFLRVRKGAEGALINIHTNEGV